MNAQICLGLLRFCLLFYVKIHIYENYWNDVVDMVTVLEIVIGGKPSAIDFGLPLGVSTIFHRKSELPKKQKHIANYTGREKVKEREMASSLSRWLVDPKKNWFAAQHMKSLSKRLRKYGIHLLSETLISKFYVFFFFFLFWCWFQFFGILQKLGLRYDDLYDPYYDLDVKEALNRLPREIVDARNQRLKRAMDLSTKHEYLPENLQVLSLFSTPFLNSISYQLIVFLIRSVRFCRFYLL